MCVSVCGAKAANSFVAARDNPRGRSAPELEMPQRVHGSLGSAPVGPAADHHRSDHATAPNRPSVAGRVHATCNGIGPLGSHGCSATASATFQVPRSITPSAASMTL